MSLALIGITCGMKTQADKKIVAIPEAYMQAVFKAGGLPAIIPETVSPAKLDGLRQRLDGLLLTGGADIDPLRFDGLPSSKVYGIDEQRDEVEINLAAPGSQHRLALPGHLPRHPGDQCGPGRHTLHRYPRPDAGRPEARL